MTSAASPAVAARPRAAALPLLLLIAVATALRLYGLGSQLWLDETSALNSIRRPALAIVTEWPGASSHILYELLAHGSIVLFGTTPFALRIVAAVFGIADVAMLYVLAARIFDRQHAVLMSALLAVSYHHVFYSQDARGYTALIFFFLVTSYLLVGIAERPAIGRREGILYALMGALTAYANPLGLFVVPAQALAALVEWRRRVRAGRPAFPIAPFLGYAVLSGVLTALLYAPFLSSLAAFTRRNVASPAEGPRLGFGLVLELLEGLKAAFFGPVGLVVAATVGVTGLVVWYRRNRFSAELLLMPLVVEAAILAALGAGLHPRYFAPALPVLFIVGGAGLIELVRRIVRSLGTRPRLAASMAMAFLVGVTVLSALPLVRYYRVPKQDFVGAMRTVDSLARPGEVKVGVYVAGHMLNGYYAAGYATVETLDDLLTLERSGNRLWLVTTLERVLRLHDARLYDHIRGEYRRVTVLPASVGDGEMRIYERPAAR